MAAMDMNTSLFMEVKNLQENIKYWSKTHLLDVRRCHTKFNVNKYISFPPLHQNKYNLGWPNEVSECKRGRLEL